jgi:hypothetical protein
MFPCALKERLILSLNKRSSRRWAFILFLTLFIPSWFEVKRKTKSIKNAVKTEMSIMPIQGFMLRKRKKMKSKILPKTELNIHIILFLQLCHCGQLEGAWQSYKKRLRLPRRFAPRNDKLLYEIAQPVPNIVKESSSLLAMTHIIK